MNLNNLKHEADKIRLTSAEKSVMRARIFGAPSYFVFFAPRYVVALLVVLVVLVGSSTAYAAQGSLPGDLLYPVKVSVNEKVEVALAPTPVAKAEVQVRLAERRVDEARELSVRGRLDEKTAKILTDDFDEHSAQALALVEPDEQEAASAPAQAVTTMSIAAPESGSSSASSDKEKPSVKKSRGHRDELRESLRVKGEVLKEIKIRSQRQEIKDGGGEDGGIKVELQIDR